MTIQTFIEKACEGTFYLYDPYYRSKDKIVKFHMLLHQRVIVEDEHGHKHRIPVSDVLLSVEAWKAVGKVEGWEYKEAEKGNGMKIDPAQIDSKEREAIAKEWGIKPDWLVYMHDMIDALAEGKTTEQYLETL